MGGGAGRLTVRTLNGMGCLPVRTLNGMGCLPERDVKRDLAMRLYFCPVPFTWKNFARTFFVPSRQSGIPVKAGQFLSYKHSVQLCRDDIMLTLQIKSRVKSSRVETFSCKPGVKSVPSRQTSRPTSHINRF